MKKRRINKLMLVFSIIGGIIGYIVGEILINAFMYRIPNILLVGIYFAVFSLCVVLMCFLAERISPKLTSASWNRNNLKMNMFIIIPVTVAAMFLVGCFVQFIYGLNSKSKPNVEFDDYVFLMDNSGSMYSSDPDNLRISQIDKLIDELDSTKRIGYYAFSSETEKAFDLQQVNESSKQKMHNAIHNTNSDGGTDIHKALQTALEDVKPKLSPNRTTALILISDGVDYFNTDPIVQECVDNNVVITCIGLGINFFNNGELMSRLADGTGGNFYDIHSAEQIIGVFTNIKQNTSSTRLLLSKRYADERTNALLGIERVLFIALFGVLLGISLGFLFDNKQLLINFMVGGAVTGILAGLSMELGLYIYSNERFCRLFMCVLLSIVVCVFTAVRAYEIVDNTGFRQRVNGAYTGDPARFGNDSVTQGKYQF